MRERREEGWYGHSIHFSQCLFSCRFFLLLFVDTNYFGLRYYTQTQPFFTLFPFRLFYFRFLGSYYHPLITHFFPYFFLSFFFFIFFFSIPFSHMSILGARTTRAFNPSFLILQTGKIPAGYMVAFCSPIFFSFVPDYR